VHRANLRKECNGETGVRQESTGLVQCNANDLNGTMLHAFCQCVHSVLGIRDFCLLMRTDASMASFGHLFQFTSSFEKLLLFIGMLCALGCGAAMPTMLIAFGDTFDQLGVAETLPGQSVLGTEMTKMLLTFMWIGIGLGAGKCIYISSVDYVCSAQMLKYKAAFLKAVLRQEVAWYDTSSPEELSTKFEQSMVKVKKVHLLYHPQNSTRLRTDMRNALMDMLIQ